MQSIVVPTSSLGGSTAAATITLLRNILSDSPSNNRNTMCGTTRRGLLSKLRHLINESVVNGGRFNYRLQQLQNAIKPTPITSSSSSSSSNTSNAFTFNILKFLLPYNSLFWSLPNSPFIVLDKLAVQAAVKALHLMTAYSGYSKDYLNSHYNTNIRSTRISVPAAAAANETSKLLKKFGNSRKGCIGDDAWFIAKQQQADVLGKIKLNTLMLKIFN